MKPLKGFIKDSENTFIEFHDDGNQRRNHVIIIIAVICSVKASYEARKWPMRLLCLAPFFHVCERGRGGERDCLCIHRSIPGLKLVPARSPNGSIDHCSVPFSNQRTAVVVSATQEITHFNCNYIFTAEAKVERESVLGW